MHTHLAVNGDLPAWAALLACVLAIASLGVLVLWELRRRERGGALIVVTGVAAIGALTAAVMRPVRIAARESVVGAKVVVLADTSRSMALHDGRTTRAEVQTNALDALAKASRDTRMVVLGFGDGAPQ